MAARMLVVLSWLLLASPATAQMPAPETKVDSAPVEVDGDPLFRVRGMEALPAEQRAARISTNITTLAADRSFHAESLRTVEHIDGIAISAGGALVMLLTNEDAALEGIDRALLAPAYVDRIRRAITDYRHVRTREGLVASAGRSVAAIAIAATLIAVLLWLLRRSEGTLRRGFDRRMAALTTGSRAASRTEGLWQMVPRCLSMIRWIGLLVVALFLVEYVLNQFPWTRANGLHLFEQIAGPLAAAGLGFVASIPNLVFLVIVFFVTRFLVVFARLYFDAVQQGSVALRGFEPSWAQPTFNLVRFALIVIAAIIAYPYIPGSNSEAFKGVSILAGLLLSLGSSSAVGNIISGYMLIYRRAFLVGDRVKIGDVVGTVTEIRLAVTQIHTFEHEEVTIPNSAILASEVTNFSRPARERRLILHSEVGVGYQVPWRQVEAMLLEAAKRTDGVLQEPSPFVLQTRLGEFAISYRIHAYTERAKEIPFTYARLHRNILDQFNEYGVQIMTPFYEGDPEKPLIVPKDQWLAAPARADGKS